jgi:hypothetical protein
VFSNDLQGFTMNPRWFAPSPSMMTDRPFLDAFGCTACSRLFEPSHRLFVLRCTRCGAPFSANESRGFDPSAARPAASPSAAALVFSLL